MTRRRPWPPTDRPGQVIQLPSAEALLTARDVRREFRLPRGVRAAVDGVSFDLWPGEILGLVGESGCGKSTLARLVVGLDAPTSGAVRLAGDRVDRLGRLARRRLQILFQDPHASLDPRLTVEASVTEGLPALPRRQRASRAAALLEAVGLPAAHLPRFPHELSGGQCQRVALARALAVDPEVLVADEPLSALDVSVQAQIVNLLDRLRRERGLTQLLIAHDLRVVRHAADRAAVMYLGRFVETGPAKEVFGAPLHPYTRALVAAAPTADPVRARTGPPVPLREPPGGEPPSGGCPFAPRCPHAEDRCLVEAPPLRRVSADRAAACHFAEHLPRHGPTDAGLR